MSHIRTVGELRKLMKGLPAHALIAIQCNQQLLPEEPRIELLGISVGQSEYNPKEPDLTITVGLTYLDDFDEEFTDEETEAAPKQGELFA